MEQSLKKYIAILIRFRVWILGVIAFWMLMSTYLILNNLTIDNSLSIWFLDDDPQYQEYTNYQKEYGSDEIIVGMIPLQEELNQAIIYQLKKTHQQLEVSDFVAESFSVAKATYPVISSSKLILAPLYDSKRSTKSSNQLFKDFSVLTNQLISEDQKNLFIYIQLNPTPEIESKRAELVNQITAIFASNFDQYHLSGPPILNNAYNTEIFNESIWFGVMTILLISLLLFLLLPHIKYLPIALASISAPIVILFGITSYMGYQLNMISMLIPTILLVYGVSDSIHITNIFHKESQKAHQLPLVDRIVMMLRKSIVPCSITTLTTMISYIALYLSPLPALNDMGFLSSLGLFLSFVFVYLINVIGFSYLQTSPQNKLSEKRIFDHFTEPLLEGVNRLTKIHRKSIISGFTIILLASILSIAGISIDTRSLDLLADGSTKRDLELIEHQLHGSSRIQLTIHADSAAQLLNASTFEKLRLFENSIAKNKNINTPISLVSLQDFINKRYPQLSNQSIDQKKIIETFENTKESSTFYNFLGAQGRELLMTLNVPQLNTKELKLLIEFIEGDFNTIFKNTGIQLKFNGFAVLYSKLNEFILETQLKSFLFAFIAAYLCLLFFVKKIKTAFLILIPNIIPIGFVLMTMSFFDIPIDVTTAMITPIMLGIIMDDSIHLLYNFRRFRVESHSMEISINQSIHYTGKALLGSTIALTGGFLVIATSSVPSVQNFGILCTITVITALISDFLLLPALLKSSLSNSI